MLGLFACVGTRDHGNHFVGEFEGGAFEGYTAGGNVEAEAEIDVEDMTFGIDHDVAVMTVFELQEIGDDRISCHTRDEVVTSLLELGTVGAIVFAHEELIQTVDMFSSKHIS